MSTNFRGQEADTLDVRLPHSGRPDPGYSREGFQEKDQPRYGEPLPEVLTVDNGQGPEDNVQLMTPVEDLAMTKNTLRCQFKQLDLLKK